MRYFSTTLIVSEQTTLDPIHHGSLPGVCYGIEEESTVEEEIHFGDQHPSGEKEILLWSNDKSPGKNISTKSDPISVV
jgi:hypothetical protein